MRVLIVEGETGTTDYLNRGLSEREFTVDLTDNGISGHHLALHGKYGVIVLDVMLPGVGGCDVLRALYERQQTLVIMLTACEHVGDRVRGLREGADGYLIKPFSLLELVARLQALTRCGGNHESRSQMRIADLPIDLLNRKTSRSNARLELTAKEYTLLCVLAQRSGEILSRTAIAELVWGIGFDTDTDVMEVAIRRLRTKLDGSFENKLLHTTRGMDYILKDHAPAGSSRDGHILIDPPGGNIRRCHDGDLRPHRHHTLSHPRLLN